MKLAELFRIRVGLGDDLMVVLINDIADMRFRELVGMDVMLLEKRHELPDFCNMLIGFGFEPGEAARVLAPPTFAAAFIESPGNSKIGG